MFIHFGEKTGRFKVGRVAAFCPICRDVAVHRLVSVRKQMHVQGLGIGRGKELHEETTCEVRVITIPPSSAPLSPSALSTLRPLPDMKCLVHDHTPKKTFPPNPILASIPVASATQINLFSRGTL
ncbi:MAG: hypothetical protein KF691_12500 [Phycisphaeraceae bacterium]|nr:hypothetical protein [Phycisphaeraceae bacterium]